MWNKVFEVAFGTLKKKLTSASILAFPDFTEAFILDADASSYGLVTQPDCWHCLATLFVHDS